MILRASTVEVQEGREQSGYNPQDRAAGGRFQIWLGVGIEANRVHSTCPRVCKRTETDVEVASTIQCLYVNSPGKPRDAARTAPPVVFPVGPSFYLSAAPALFCVALLENPTISCFAPQRP